ncbi:hypothetical protein N8T08_005941 [Aspergillus melleus]|uniref:Uncharacterized protein n=1 Tax=Aspergillus melleus TaxID=138277 RepID=A0ACC3B128_9EURO|nr:hypothetical protein N8T08_005941 [Aspergillus melleus]
MNTLSLQVMSDLHPKYSDFDVPVMAPYLAFLGNVNQVSQHKGFLHREIDIFTFFENHFRRYGIVFFVLGVREIQRMDYGTAKERIPSYHRPRIIEEFWQFSVGNNERSVDDHDAGHDSDVAWLNQQVAHMAEHEPHRKVGIFTHHSPTVDRWASTIPLPHWSEVSTTDLSKEVCWTSPTVRMWAFACTQVNCDLTLDGKKLVTNKQY